MSVALYAFTCGTLTGEFVRLMEGGEGDITIPVPVYLIEHPKGRVLFDAGLRHIRRTVIDDNDRIGLSASPLKRVKRLSDDLGAIKGVDMG